MRSKALDQYRYVKTAGTAFDRTGFDTGIIIAIGGTSSTAIKVQTCATSSGTFVDYATIVAAADAGSSTNVGDAIDLSGAEKYIKVTGATTASVVLVDGRINPNA